METNFKQHVVPQFYIEFFCSDGDFRVFVRVSGTDEIRLKAPRGQGYEVDAFTVIDGGQRNTACDNANKAIEDFCAPLLVKLNGFSTPTIEQWRAIFFLTANLICRSRWARDHSVWQVERAQKVLPSVFETLKELPRLPQSVTHFGLTPNELDDTPALLDRAAKLLYPVTAALGPVPVAEALKAGKSCDLLVAPTAHRFITSDDPVLILKDGKVAKLSLGHDYLAGDDIEVYLPLKPNIACLWSAKSTLTCRTVTADEVTVFNDLIWRNCYERVFASRRSDLSDCQDK